MVQDREIKLYTIEDNVDDCPPIRSLILSHAVVTTMFMKKVIGRAR